MNITVETGILLVLVIPVVVLLIWLCCLWDIDGQLERKYEAWLRKRGKYLSLYDALCSAWDYMIENNMECDWNLCDFNIDENGKHGTVWVKDGDNILYQTRFKNKYDNGSIWFENKVVSYEIGSELIRTCNFDTPFSEYVLAMRVYWQCCTYHQRHLCEKTDKETWNKLMKRLGLEPGCDDPYEIYSAGDIVWCDIFAWKRSHDCAARRQAEEEKKQARIKARAEKEEAEAREIKEIKAALKKIQEMLNKQQSS